MAGICNACRYCEGYCAVFPAIERRIDFARDDRLSGKSMPQLRRVLRSVPVRASTRVRGQYSARTGASAT